MSAREPCQYTAELSGQRLHWVEWGERDAPIILALHGVSGMCRIWDPLGQALSGRYRVIALDQRGHGDSAWPVGPDYRTDDYLGDIEAFVAHLELDQFALVGLSMGGMNSMAYAARHPDKVTQLVVVDIRPALDPDKRPNRDQDKRTAETGHTVFATLDGAFIARKFTHPHTPNDSVRHHVQHGTKQLPDGGWTSKHDPRASFYWKPRNLWQELPRIAAPVLIVRGGESPVLPMETAEQMCEAFPNARLVTIDGAAHTVPEDQPEKFIAVVDEFLASDAL